MNLEPIYYVDGQTGAYCWYNPSKSNYILLDQWYHSNDELKSLQFVFI